MKKKARKNRHAAPVSPVSLDDSRREAIVYKSELDYISRCILDYPDIETGGQLFGYWTENGVPVVLFAIGPGPGANHQRTFFNQDVDYLLEVGTALRDRFGLIHIGEWHSHHKLGLARPSGHDERTMVSNIRESRLGRFLLCIGNCNGNGIASTLNPFLCDENRCSDARWDVIFKDSPIRRQVYAQMGSVIIEPRTINPRHMDSRLNGGSTPTYSPGSWMQDRQNGVLLNRMLTHVKGLHSRHAEVSVKLDDRGRVHIVSVEYRMLVNRFEEDLMFPDDFPASSPVCRMHGSFGTDVTIHGTWFRSGDVFSDFVNYYTSIRKQY